MGPQFKVSSDTGEAADQNYDSWFTTTSLQLLVFENKLIYFSTKTYVVGIQSDSSFVYPKHMVKQMDKKIIILLRSKHVLIWTLSEITKPMF